MTPDIETIKLCHTFGRDTPFETAAIKDISIRIPGGQLVGLLGHTGSGKSTLIQHLNGLLKPVSGQVLLGGEDINASKERSRDARFRVGLVFQYPEYQLFEETVFADIAFGPRNMRLSEEDVKARVHEAAGFVGISGELFDKSPMELSGGQKRRVAIAGVVAMRPSVLVLDEPTAGLDPSGRSSLIENILAYRESSGCTVIYVTHNMDEIAKIAERIIVLCGGEVSMDGAPGEIFRRGGELTAMGLDVPNAALIAAKLQELGITGLPGDIYTLDMLEDAVMERYYQIQERA